MDGQNIQNSLEKKSVEDEEIVVSPSDTTSSYPPGVSARYISCEWED